MPQAHLSASRLMSRLPDGLAREQVIEQLFRSKVELSEWEGDELIVEVSPDRLDLLNEGGLALHIEGGLGIAAGLPKVDRRTAGPSDRFDVDASVLPLRPEIAGVIMAPPKGETLDQGLLEEAIRYQETLHATVGLDRRAASIGIYPIDRVAMPVRYSLEPVGEVRFVPLDESEAVDGPGFFARHPMAQRYGGYGRVDGRCLTLRDSAGEILSLPPILNSRGAGEARAGDGSLLIESTGTRAARVNDSVAFMSLPFLARRWSVQPVRVARKGEPESDGLGPIADRSIPLTSVRLAAVAGEAFPPNRVEEWVRVARLGVTPVPHGYQVQAPPYRPDLLAEVDVIEDVLLARGVRMEDGLLPPALSAGRWLPETRFRRRVGELLLGVGYTELYTSVLVAGESVARWGRSDAVAIENPVSELYSHVRDRILVSLGDVLARNTRHGYPQRFFEVGPVIVRDAKAEAGARTIYHAGGLLAADSAGFADVAALADYLVGAFGAKGVREPVALAGTLPGRSARLKIAGETVAEMGEIHPEVLSALGAPVPAAFVELDLTSLWPLVRPSAIS